MKQIKYWLYWLIFYVAKSNIITFISNTLNASSNFSNQSEIKYICLHLYTLYIGNYVTLHCIVHVHTLYFSISEKSFRNYLLNSDVIKNGYSKHIK